MSTAFYGPGVGMMQLVLSEGSLSSAESEVNHGLLREYRSPEPVLHVLKFKHIEKTKSDFRNAETAV